QEALQRLSLAGLLESGVDLFHSYVAADHGDQIHGRYVRSRNAYGETVQLALEFGNRQVDGLGGASRGRNHRESGSAGAAEIGVREVEDHLVIRVAVNGGHG